MSSDTFYLEVKSTLDKLMTDLIPVLQAVDPNLSGADLDDFRQTDHILASSDASLVWQLVSLEQDPRDPLWEFKFYVGVKTTEDKANYNLAELMALAMKDFTVNNSFDIADYSGATASAKRGSATIIRHETNPQMFDHQSGIRLTMVCCKVIRCG